MKKTTTLILLLLVQLGLYGQVTNYYNFKASQKPYTQISSGTELHITGNGDLYPFVIDNPFNLFGQTIGDTLLIGTWSGGFMISYTPAFAFSFDVFLADFIPQSGRVFSDWDTLATGPVLSFEWRNFKLRNHPNSDSVNFKINIHTNTEVVEYHYGPSFTTATAAFQYGGMGPGVYFWLLTPDFSQYYYLNAVGGNPSNPVHSQTSLNNVMTGVPPEGMLYRFEPYNIGLNEKSIATSSIYPNPATNSITINGMEKGNVAIISITGEKVYEGSFTNSTVDLSHLPSGIYIIKVRGDLSEIRQTLIKN